MKLTKDQKAIIEKIIDGTVYDIPSYLRVFGKGAERQYNEDEIRNAFVNSEMGQAYSYKEIDDHYFAEVYDNAGKLIREIPVTNEQTYKFKRYHLEKPVKAELAMRIPSQIVNYAGKRYSFNFLENSYFVANRFKDIVDFITLWSYLKQEALIIEVSKNIENSDLSVFFEKESRTIQKGGDLHWKENRETVSAVEDKELPKYHVKLVPYKLAKNYITEEWKFNDEHLIMCAEFIGKKIFASSILQIYRQNKYRTFEEISQRRNLVVAWVAVGISVFSVVVGNIFPLFEPQETEYLNKLSQQVSVIESEIALDEKVEDVMQKMDEILSMLKNMEKNSDSRAIKELVVQIQKLKLLVQKSEN